MISSNRSDSWPVNAWALASESNERLHQYSIRLVVRRSLWTCNDLWFVYFIVACAEWHCSAHGSPYFIAKCQLNVYVSCFVFEFRYRFSSLLLAARFVFLTVSARISRGALVGSFRAIKYFDRLNFAFGWNAVESFYDFVILIINRR